MVDKKLVRHTRLNKDLVFIFNELRSLWDMEGEEFLIACAL